MTSVLAEICEKKRAHVAARKAETPLHILELSIQAQQPARPFLGALKQASLTRTALITEVKKASPSKGIIRADFHPVEIARTYEASGAACLSVLTDEPYFQGSDDYLTAVRAAVHLPILRKDFMVDPYQIYESRALGADCILIIMAALDDSQAADIYTLATELGMDALIEVHNHAELERALRVAPQMIGVNNRDLKSLKVDVQTSHSLAEHIPEDIFKISESGISDPTTIQSLKTSGYQAFLIGESLMRQDDIAAATRTLMEKSI